MEDSWLGLGCDRSLGVSHTFVCPVCYLTMPPLVYSLSVGCHALYPVCCHLFGTQVSLLTVLGIDRFEPLVHDFLLLNIVRLCTLLSFLVLARGSVLEGFILIRT